MARWVKGGNGIKIKNVKIKKRDFFFFFFVFTFSFLSLSTSLLPHTYITQTATGFNRRFPIRKVVLIVIALVGGWSSGFADSTSAVSWRSMSAWVKGQE